MAETTSPTKPKGFDPGQHLTNIKGQEYLEVKWRLAWLRDEHPDAQLNTQLIKDENGRATFRCDVSFPADDSATGEAGAAICRSSGYGSCTIDEFQNYIEKAETKAIGRALAHAGYGTQFAGPDTDEGIFALADAPVNRAPQQAGTPGDALATNAQKSMIQYKARQAQLEPEALVQLIREETGKEFSELTKRQASRVIDVLGERQAGPPQMRR